MALVYCTCSTIIGNDCGTTGTEKLTTVHRYRIIQLYILCLEVNCLEVNLYEFLLSWLALYILQSLRETEWFS